MVEPVERCWLALAEEFDLIFGALQLAIRAFVGKREPERPVLHLDAFFQAIDQQDFRCASDAAERGASEDAVRDLFDLPDEPIVENVDVERERIARRFAKNHRDVVVRDLIRPALNLGDLRSHELERAPF